MLVSVCVCVSAVFLLLLLQHMVENDWEEEQGGGAGKCGLYTLLWRARYGLPLSACRCRLPLMVWHVLLLQATHTRHVCAAGQTHHFEWKHMVGNDCVEEGEGRWEM